MSRSIKKGVYCHYSLIKKVNNMLLNGKRESIKTWSRSSTILSSFVGFTFLVHNGKKHFPVYVTRDKVGHKFGEFSLTRTFRKHTSLKKSKKIYF